VPVTIKDIARETGVSVSTISRILNGKSTQNKRLVEIVKQKAKELNYQVNTAAAGLRTNKTRLIGIVMPEVNNDFFAEILSGVEEVVEEHGYNLLICQSHESAKKELKLIRSLNSCNVEGILIASSIESHSSDDLKDEFSQNDKPVVYFDRVPTNSDYPYITVDDYNGMVQVTEHLLHQNRQRFLYVGFTKTLTNDRERLRGVKSALEKSSKELLAECYDPTEEIFLQLVSDHHADAIICYNDFIAANILSFLKHGNIQVPNDILVSGFDNRHLCELVSPTLTSIDHSTRLIGKGAAQMLFQQLISKENTTNIVLPARLVIRESTTNKQQ
jgi:LacI family transcriptional regulator